MSSVEIISFVNRSVGYAPITHLADLLARLLDGQETRIGGTRRRLLHKLSQYVPIPARRGCGTIVLSPWLGSVQHAWRAVNLFRAPRPRALWIIDSFWTEELARKAPMIRRHFDLVCFMQGFDREVYRKHFGEAALCLPWGTDALHFPDRGMDRRYDLLRFGRQPAAWEDDGATRALCDTAGLRFVGRPIFAGLGPQEQYAVLKGECLAQAAYVLAHSNLCDASTYTHPEKEYITGRWTDALAGGAFVAGRPPERDLGLIDWPEALLRIPPDDAKAGIGLIREARAAWTPEVARRNREGALRTLDWRWRIRELAYAMGLRAPKLDAEMMELTRRLTPVCSRA
ncbi:MAG: hypothetical protein ACXIUV_10460 [Alkalilacustris sp.]